MHKPLIVNKFLAKRRNDENNLIMYKKLNSVKSSIDHYCPESFYFFKTGFSRPNQIDNYDLETDRRNRIMINKIKYIACKKESVKGVPNSRPVSQESRNYKQKWNILRIAQDNLTMAKRLTEQRPTYNTKKLNEEYDHKRYLMNNISEFPLIKYNLPKKVNTIRDEENTKNTFYKNKTQTDRYKEEADGSVVLFDKKSYIMNFGVCNVKFLIKDKQLSYKQTCC